ncbi:DUF982 domain-containing protein [Rhizobium sp. XQZ8]|nr:DUF982 domain-containing protein [Rhizobium populisoli]
MMRGDWEKPVEIELDRLGMYRTIADTDAAARTLVFDWPLEEGQALAAAKATCFAVLQGKAEPESAREAFIAAAAEADRSVRISRGYPKNRQ